MNLEDVKIEDLGQYLGLNRYLAGFSTEEIENEYRRKQDIRQDKIDKRNRDKLDKYYAEAEELFDEGYYKGNMVNVQVPMSIPDMIPGPLTDNLWLLSGRVLDWPDTVFGMVPWFHATNITTGQERHFHKHSLGCPVIMNVKESNKTFDENINTEINKYTPHSIFLE